MSAYAVNDGNTGGNYSVTTGTASGTISQASLTINATTDSRGYNGTTDSAATPTMVGTVYAPDSVTGLDQVFDSRNAGRANPHGERLRRQRRLTLAATTASHEHGERLDQPGAADDQRDDRQPRLRRHHRFSRHADSRGTVYSPDSVTGFDQVFDSRNAGARTLTVSAYASTTATLAATTASRRARPAGRSARHCSRSMRRPTAAATTARRTQRPPTVAGAIYAPDTVTGLDQVFDSRNAGARTLTASYVVNDGNGGGNYDVTANTASGSISQALLTINAVADGQGYDGTTDSDETPTVAGTVYVPDSVTGLDQVFDSRNAGPRTLTASYVVNDGNGGGNYSVTANTAAGSISQALLTINAVTDSKGYDGTINCAATPTVVGTVYAPDTVTGLDQVFDSRNAGARILSVSAYMVNDANTGGNYSVSTSTTSGSISAAFADDQCDDRQPRLRRHDGFSSHSDSGGHGLRAGQRYGARPGV